MNTPCIQLNSPGIHLARIPPGGRSMGRQSGAWLLVFTFFLIHSAIATAKKHVVYSPGWEWAPPRPVVHDPNPQLSNPWAQLRTCPNRSGMCRYEGYRDTTPRQIHILSDGRYAVWINGVWTEVEPAIAQEMNQRYRNHYHSLSPADKQLVNSALSRYGHPIPKPTVVVNPPKPPKPYQHVNGWLGQVPYQLPRPTPEPRKPPSKYALPSAWLEQKNQGSAGTCHAFALVPSVDALENSSGNGGFRASENWMVFLSVLDRLCDPFQKEVHTASGYHPASTLKRMLSIGYCSSQYYSDYNTAHLTKEQERLAAVQRSSFSLPSEPSSVKELRVFENLMEKSDPIQFEWNSAQRSVQLKGFIAPQHENSFKNAFGISSKYADKLCRSDQYRSAGDLLEGTDASLSFRMCLSEAMEKRNKLSSCRVAEVQEGRTPGDKMSIIKNALLNNTPIVASVRNYNDKETPKEHNYHALSIVGYDDEKGEFSVMNSWGEGNNHPISYSKIDDIYRFSYLDCGGKKGSLPNFQFAGR